jgi:hypothetical protein
LGFQTAALPVPIRTSLLALLAASMVAVGVGCGTPCVQIARDRDAFQARQATANGEPHFVASVPLDMVNQMIEPRVRAIAPLPLDLPSGGILEGYLDGFVLQPRQATLVPGERGLVGIVVLLDVVRRGQAIFSLRLEGEIQPRLDSSRRRVEVELRLEDFRSMEPQISPGAAENLAESLGQMIPGMVRMLIPPGAITAAAGTITSFILSSAYPLLRDRLFAGLEPIARFAIDLPEIPIESISFSTSAAAGGQLVLSGVTSLPVSSGVGPGAELEPSAQGIAMVMSGSAVAELANWGMAEGRLPQRFDEQGRPQSDGPYEVALAWSQEEGERRPLRVHVWRLQDRCLRAVLSARPDLRLEGGEVVLDVQDRHVDVLEGPPMAEIARWFAPIWLRAMNHAQRVASTFVLDAGGRPLRARVISIERTGDAIRLGLDLVEGSGE